MEIITYKAGEKVYGVVKINGVAAYTTSEYYTERMACADMYCWVAFQGENMDQVAVDMDEVYTARQAITKTFAEVSAKVVARAVAEAYRNGLVVEIKEGAMGQRYIEISNGKGSAYGQYHIGADFRDKVEAQR
jgi:hypothetical protein